MEELIKQIGLAIGELTSNLEMYAKGNKSAGVRARKATLKLERLGKQFRKESVNS